MIRYSPNGAAGSGPTSDIDSSAEDLQKRIEQLEERLEEERNKHQLEMQKGIDAFVKLQNSSPSVKESDAPTRPGGDGYETLPGQGVSILVDVQNMYYAARNLYNSKLEFSKLLKLITRGRRLTRAIAYIVERPGMEQTKFVEVLRRNGFEVRKKMIVERSDGSQRGDWNIGISLDASSISKHVDVIVLVTGDGDFVTLADYLRALGNRVEVASFYETTSNDLIRACDHYHRLNERVLLPGAQFQSPEEDEDELEDVAEDAFAEDAISVPTSRRKPSRSPIDDLDDED